MPPTKLTRRVALAATGAALMFAAAPALPDRVSPTRCSAAMEKGGGPFGPPPIERRKSSALTWYR
jgi:hypothetical protein